MKTPLSTFTVCLLALIAVATAVARPIEGNAQDDFVRLPAFEIRTKVWTSAKGQTVPRALVALSYAGQQRGTISGQVVLPSGHQVSNRIRITLNGQRISSFMYTDNKGRFVFQGMSDGTYMLEVEGDSNLYEPVTQEVRVIYGAHPVLVITLREKRQLARKTSSNVVSAGELDQQVPGEASKEFEKGAQLSEKGKIQDAIERFKNAIAIFPNYLMARNNLGAQYLKLGKWAEAAEQFEAAIEIDSKALNPRQNLAIALVQQKKYVQAIEHLNQAISIDSSSPTTHLYAGIASLGLDEIDQAERELSKALSLGGARYSDAHFFLALVHMKRGAREPAIRELNAYLEKLPTGEKAPRARQLLEKLKQ